MTHMSWSEAELHAIAGPTDVRRRPAKYGGPLTPEARLHEIRLETGYLLEVYAEAADGDRMHMALRLQALGQETVELAAILQEPLAAQIKPAI